MKTGKSAQLFLEQIQSESSKSTFENLSTLVNILENKTDPEPVEIHLIENIYSFLEQLERIKLNLSSYTKDTKRIPSNKLQSLYENIDEKNIWG